MESEREGAGGGGSLWQASSNGVPSNVRVRLAVFNVCRGAETVVQASEDTPIHKIKEKAQDILQVRLENQVLLLEDGTKVHSTHKVGSYPSLLNPNDQQTIYLFDNRYANPRVPPDYLVPLECPRVLPPKPSFSRSGLLDDLDIDHQEFVFELKYSQATLEAVTYRINLMKSKWKECEGQLGAVGVVGNSVRIAADSLKEKRESFRIEYERHAEKVGELLGSFESDVANLKATPLAPMLKVGKAKEYTTLIDFTPESKLRDWRDEVKAKNDSITSLVSQWFKKSEDTLIEFAHFSDPSKRENASRIVMEAKELYATHHSLSLQAFGIMEKLDKDQQTAYQMIQSGKRWGLKDDFIKFSSEHKSLLELLDLYNRQSEELLKRFNNIRQACLVSVIEAMQIAAKIQQNITGLRKNDLQVIVSATKKEKEDFFYLRFVHEMTLTIAEIVKELHRRVAWKRHVSKYLSLSFPSFDRGLIELGKEMEDERTRRQHFVKKFGSLIPQDLLPLLQTDLPRLDVSEKIARLDSFVSIENFSETDLDAMSKEFVLPSFPPTDEISNLLELLKKAENGTNKAFAQLEKTENVLGETKELLAKERERSQQLEERLERMETLYEQKAEEERKEKERYEEALASAEKELEKYRETLVGRIEAEKEKDRAHSRETLAFEELIKGAEFENSTLKESLRMADERCVKLMDATVCIRDIKINDRVILFPIGGNPETYQVFSLDPNCIMVLDRDTQGECFKPQIAKKAHIVGQLILQERASHGEGGRYRLGTDDFFKVTLVPL